MQFAGTGRLLDNSDIVAMTPITHPAVAGTHQKRVVVRLVVTVISRENKRSGCVMG